MNENSKKIRELTEAMRAERDIRIRSRMMAVLGVLKGYSTKTVSDFVDVSQRTVQLRVARFDESGIGGLRDASGRGRASRARYGRIRRLADRLAGKSMLTPRKLRNWIRGRLDARDNLCGMRRILRFLEFSSKRSATMYASAADADSVRQWQAGATGMISEAKRRGFTIVVQDKSIFLRTGTNGRKLWSRVGDLVTVSRHGRRDKTIVYGTLAEDGTRLMRQYGRFDGPTFVRYLKEVRQEYGRLIILLDNASYHRYKVVNEFVKSTCGEIKLAYLPPYTPQLNPIEIQWRVLKEMLAGRYFESTDGLVGAITDLIDSGQMRPVRLMKYLAH